MRVILLFILISATYTQINAQNIYDGLVGYWPMNCNAIDSLGTNMDGIIQGNPSCTIGKLDEALFFKEGDYIDLPEDRTLEMVSGNGFTWSLWFKLDSLPQNDNDGLFQTFISFADPQNQSDIFLGLGSLTDPKDELAFIVDGPGGVGNSAQNNLANISWGPPTEGWRKDKWYHVAGIRDYENNSVELYFDGVKRESATYFEPQEPFDENLPMQFGRFFDGETASNNFTGGLDEIRIYNRVLTESEVLILFSARPEQLTASRDTIKYDNIKCQADSTILINIQNIGPSDFIISEFDLRNGEAFKIENPASDETLLDQQLYVLGLTFEPPSEGIFYDTLFVRNPFGVQPLILYLEGEKEVLIETPTFIDFGELVSCESNSFLTAQIEIDNINIDEGLVFEGIDLPGGEITSSTYLPIPENNSNQFSVTFTPNSFGTFTEIGQVTFENCNLSYPIEVRAKYTFLEKSFSSTFDFSDKEVGITHFEDQVIKNTGTTEFEILNIESLDNLGQFFFESSTFNPIILEPSQSFSFDLGFTPEGKEASAKFVLTTSSPCGIQYDTLDIFGYGKHRAYFDLKVKDINAKIGETKDLILEISNPLNLDISEIDSINFNLKYNKTIIKPEIGLENNTSSTYSNWISDYNYTIIPELNNNNQEFNLDKLRFALGNESLPIIEINNINVYGGLATINAVPGALLLGDICDKGEITRLLIADSWLELGDVTPNPARDQITFNFSLIEPGITKLKVFDSNGILVETIANNYFDIGSYEVKYQTFMLNSGIYFYTLETPTQSISKRFHITK